MLSIQAYIVWKISRLDLEKSYSCSLKHKYSNQTSDCELLRKQNQNKLKSKDQIKIEEYYWIPIENENKK